MVQVEHPNQHPEVVATLRLKVSPPSIWLIPPPPIRDPQEYARSWLEVADHVQLVWLVGPIKAQ
jgi:hypothetical protein